MSARARPPGARGIMTPEERRRGGKRANGLIWAPELMRGAKGADATARRLREQRKSGAFRRIDGVTRSAFFALACGTILSSTLDSAAVVQAAAGARVSPCGPRYHLAFEFPNTRPGY